MKQFPFGIVSMLRVLKHRRPISSNFPVDIAFRCREARKKTPALRLGSRGRLLRPREEGLPIRCEYVLWSSPFHGDQERSTKGEARVIFGRTVSPPLFRKESAYRKKIIHTLWLSYKFSHYSPAITKESKNRFIDPLSQA